MNTTQQRPGTSAPTLTRTQVLRRRQALERLVFPDGLERRLSREQGWSEDHARRVVTEYRRFLILATTLGVSVTPSRTVDHAWHAHLEYTRAYWDTLCGELLGEALHHTPGEPGEDAHFQQQYVNTLTLYRETFGEDAPADLWPTPVAPMTPDRPHRNGSASLPVLIAALIAAAGVLAWGLSGGGSALTLIGGLLIPGLLLLTVNERAERAPLKAADRRSTRRTRNTEHSGSSGSSDDTTPLSAGLGGLGGLSGTQDSGNSHGGSHGADHGGHDGGGHGGGGSDSGGSDGGASCGSSCGGGCGS